MRTGIKKSLAVVSLAILFNGCSTLEGSHYHLIPKYDQPPSARMLMHPFSSADTCVEEKAQKLFSPQMEAQDLKEFSITQENLKTLKKSCASPAAEFNQLDMATSATLYRGKYSKPQIIIDMLSSSKYPGIEPR